MPCPVVPFPIADGFMALERRIGRWQAEIGASGWMDTVWPDLLETLRLLRAQVSDGGTPWRVPPWVKETAANAPDAAVLSIGAGHLRTAEQLRGTAPARWVALEPDKLALPELARHAGVEPVRASLPQFMVQPRRLGSFDLVCCAGLYERLGTPTAQRLTAACFAALRPGGRPVVANFAAEQADAG